MILGSLIHWVDKLAIYSDEILIVFIIGVPILINFLCLFVWETYPGIGWFAFSVKDVSIKIRLLSFILFICALFFLPGLNKLWGLLTLCLLIFGKE